MLDQRGEGEPSLPRVLDLPAGVRVTSLVGVLEWMLEWVGILKMGWVLEKVGMDIGAG